MRNAVQRAAFVLLSCALLLGAVKWVPEQEAPAAALPDVYVSGGYAVSTEAAYDQRSLDYAARKLQQLYDSYLTGNDGHIYLSVIPDKGSFVPAIEGYTPASAQETADALLAQLDFVRYVENAVDTPFFGSYTGKTEEPLTADTLRYLTGETLDACTVYDYETEAQESLYDLSAVDTKTPYDLYLQGSKSLLHIDSPLSATDKTLVVFRDSFGSSLIPLLAESYRTIYAVDIRYLPSQLLGRYLTFDGSEDVLFLYSVMVLQNSLTMK